MRYDLIILGTEPEGLEAARAAVEAGRLVALVGEFQTSRRPHVDGVDVVRGTARFVGEHRLRIDRVADSLDLEADEFVLATGTRSWRPAYVPFDGERVLDAEERVPDPVRTVVVVGGDAVALDRAESLARSGREVVVVDGPSHRRGRPAIPLIEGVRGIRRGVGDDSGAEAIAIERRGDAVHVWLERGDCVTAEAVVFAADRVGNTEPLNLAAIGVEPDERGRLWCDAEGHTWCPHVRAVGTLIGHRSGHGTREWSVGRAEDAIVSVRPRSRRTVEAVA